jgi:monoamine oxidase
MGAHLSEVEVAVIGAGAAGIGAARTLRERGVSFVLLEASHRIGGRGYTELVGPGQPFDLGCHWLHSASLNPFTRIADQLGFEYDRSGFSRRLHFGDRWANEAEQQDYSDFYDRSIAAAYRAAAEGRDISVAEATERESRWTPLVDYVVSLMYSVDSDQVSVYDVHNYNDTDENWRVKQGYGALIARFAADLPVELNCAVKRIDWSGRSITIETVKGSIAAGKVIVAVSTGILGGGDIRFEPALPAWKQEAIAALALGNHNRICLVFDGNVFGDDYPESATVMAGESEPMGLRIRPFGYDHVIGVTGGRFADWLERAGVEASADLLKEQLAKVVGWPAANKAVRHVVTAWRGDPWIKGAYSAAQPGHGLARGTLAEPLDDRLFFAGEATSSAFYATAHGAYMTGIAAAEKAVAALSGASPWPSRAGAPT